MKPVNARFRLTGTERAAVYKQSSVRDFDQIGWGTKVKLQQVREDALIVPMQLVLSQKEAKMFDDAEIGAEFEITISPLQEGERT